MSKTISYEDAMKELKEILDQVQDPNTPLELLQEKMKRAKELMALCEQKLRAIEESME